MITPYDFYQQSFWFVLILIVISLWELAWKGVALWFSARNQQKGWYIAILIFNTIGILPIVYLVWFRPQKEKSKEKSSSQDVQVIEVRKKKKEKKE